MWIGFDIEGSRVGILNIYATTDLWRRATFWRTLANTEPVMDSWIVEGDFNNLETLEDQQGRGPKFIGISCVEQTTWETFLFTIGGRDSWRDLSFCRWPGSLDYLWGFHREGGRLLVGLDHFYVSNWVVGRGGQMAVVRG